MAILMFARSACKSPRAPVVTKYTTVDGGILSICLRAEELQYTGDAKWRKTSSIHRNAQPVHRMSFIRTFSSQGLDIEQPYHRPCVGFSTLDHEALTSQSVTTAPGIQVRLTPCHQIYRRGSCKSCGILLQDLRLCNLWSRDETTMFNA